MSPKVALVTGSATGAGRAIALRFARRGFAVAVNYSRSEAEANETLAQVEGPRRAGDPVQGHRRRRCARCGRW